jgi:sugar (pentulose or hexulose) kinase
MKAMAHAAAGLAVGIDVGTSGVRAVAVTDVGACVAQAATPLPTPRRDGDRVAQSPTVWAEALDTCLDTLLAQIGAASVRALAIDATSGSVLLADAQGKPLGEALMYNDASAADAAARVASVAPPDCAARGTASGLARALSLFAETGATHAAHLLHQGDWLTGRLLGRFGDSDENSALKTGYDPLRRQWPTWIEELPLPKHLLPRVHMPGTLLGAVSPEACARHGCRADTQVVAGTTDGVAAFLATGAAEVGDAVTSLGSTLVVKLLSHTPLVAPEYGIYSHRLGDLWLPGGASNAGGAALLAHFSVARMAELTPLLRPDEPTGLDYYPLPATGERFPVCDPTRAPRMTPRPPDDARFFQGLLEGLAAIEAEGYERLAALGAPRVVTVRSVGGGAANAAWSRIRARRLGVPLLEPAHTEAAFGAARLAANALRRGGRWT